MAHLGNTLRTLAYLRLRNDLQESHRYTFGLIQSAFLDRTFREGAMFSKVAKR